MSKLIASVLGIVMLAAATTATSYGQDYGQYKGWTIPPSPTAGYQATYPEFHYYASMYAPRQNHGYTLPDDKHFYPYWYKPDKCKGGSIDVPDHFFDADFGPTCNAHDICYQTLDGTSASSCNTDFGIGMISACISAYGGSLGGSIVGRVTTDSAGRVITNSGVSIPSGTLTFSNGEVITLDPPTSTGAARKLPYLQDRVNAVTHAVSAGANTTVNFIQDGVEKSIDAYVDLSALTIDIGGQVIQFAIDEVIEPLYALPACLSVATKYTEAVVLAGPLLYPQSQEKERVYLDWVSGEYNLHIGQVMAPIFSLLLE